MTIAEDHPQVPKILKPVPLDVWRLAIETSGSTSVQDDSRSEYDVDVADILEECLKTCFERCWNERSAPQRRMFNQCYRSYDPYGPDDEEQIEHERLHDYHDCYKTRTLSDTFWKDVKVLKTARHAARLASQHGPQDPPAKPPQVAMVTAVTELPHETETSTNRSSEPLNEAWNEKWEEFAEALTCSKWWKQQHKHLREIDVNIWEETDRVDSRIKQYGLGVQLLSAYARVPTRATPAAAGLDLYAAHLAIIPSQ
jgi:hypothetical protein